MNNCPVRNTCPSINNAVDYLKDALTDLNDALKCEDREDMIFEIESAISRIENIDMEDLRSENAKLREWGENLLSELDEADTKMLEQ